MKGNTVYIVLGVVVMAVVAFFLFGKSASAKGFGLTGGTDSTGRAAADTLSGASLQNAVNTYNSLRAPGETFDQWYARRKAAGWSF